MRLALRIVAAFAALVVLVLVALGVYFAVIFDPNDYRDRIAEQVRTHTGRELTIGGDIGLTFFPWLGVELADVALGNAPGFGDEPFARVAEVRTSVKLMPLLRREIEVDRVLLRGLQLDLVRDAKGRSNWEDLRGAPAEPAAAEPEPRPAEDAAGAVAALAIGGIDIESARVRWDDQQKGVQHELRDFSLKTGEVRPGRAFPLSLATNIASSAPALEGRLELEGEVLADPAQERYVVDGLDLRFAGRGAGLPGGAIDARARAAVNADLRAGTLAVDNLSLDAYGLRATGTLQGQSVTTEPRFAGALQVAEFKPREVLAAAGVSVPAAADASALTRASLKARIEADAKRAMLEGLEVRLDDSLLTGSVGIADFERNALRFDLKLDAIDVDRYLPPRAADTPAQVATPGAAATAAEPTALRALDLQGKLQVGKLKLSGLQLSDIGVTARADGGVMRLQPLAATLYQGRYAGNITLDARGRALRVGVDESLTGVQIGPLLRDLTGKAERLTGRADLRMRLNGVGGDADAIKRTLGGTAEFRFSDGAVKGVNIARFLREAEALLRGQPAPPATEPEQTDFSELSGTVRFTDGVGRNDDLMAKSPLLRVSGSGSFDLGRERIDYTALASVVGTLTGQGGKELDRLRGVTVPIRIRGSFDQPSYSLDAERLLKENVKGQVKEKLEQQLDERLREGLRGLFR